MIQTPEVNTSVILMLWQVLWCLEIILNVQEVCMGFMLMWHHLYRRLQNLEILVSAGVLEPIF